MLEVYLALIIAGKRTAADTAQGDRRTIPSRFREEAIRLLFDQGLDENGEDYNR